MKNKVPKDEKEVIEILVNHCKNFYGCKCIGCGFLMVVVSIIVNLS